MLSIITNFRKTCALAFAMGLCNLTAAQTVTTVYSFDGTHGQYTNLLRLTQGRGGRFYGTTLSGGSNGTGTVFKQDASSNTNVLLSDGFGAPVGVTLAGDGNYYGTTEGGGAFGKGMLFRITSDGTITDLHDFAGASDGAYPFGPPLQALDGSLYGTTSADGMGLHAVIYKSTYVGALSTVYTFSGSNDIPFFMTQGTDGNLYVSVVQGGAYGCGAIVKVSVGGAFKFGHDFKCRGALGIQPDGALMQASDGNFYGINIGGGANNNSGTIYRMTPGGKFTLLYSFGAFAGDGVRPAGGPIQATDGNLYGSTAAGGSAGAGSLYKITLDGVYSPLYSFPKGGTASQAPQGSLTQSTSGLLYGTTGQGGTHDLGSIFTLDLGLGPFVALQRTQGKPGIGLGIFGQGFTGTTAVTFNGVPATSFTVLEDTYMTAVVPSGAGTGPVLVTTPTGILKSNKNFAQK